MDRKSNTELFIFSLSQGPFFHCIQLKKRYKKKNEMVPTKNLNRCLCYNSTHKTTLLTS